jgi:hypothetical protein
MRWTGHVARMGEEKKCTGFWWESPKERDHLENRGVDGRMEIKMDLKEIGWEGVEWIKLTWVLDLGPVAGFCKHGDELSDSGAL